MALFDSGPRPNVLGLAFAKCGTTTLARVLSQHPEVCFSRHKEAELFAHVRPDLYVREYQDLFSHYDPSRHKVLMEWSNEYIRSRDNLEHIKRLLGTDLTFCMSIRHPLAHFKSLYFYYIMTNPSSDCAVNSQLAMLQRYHRNNPWFFYDVGYERFRSVFPDSRLVVVSFEDFFKDLEGSFNKLFVSLGLSEFTGYSRERHNKTLPPRNVFFDKLLRKFMMVTFGERKTKEWYRRDWQYKPFWLRMLQRMNLREMSIDPEAEAFIAEKFAPGYHRFMEMAAADPNTVRVV
jgi:hypothetical protein